MMARSDARAVASVGHPVSVKLETLLPPCPHCGSTDAVRISYGLPTVESFENSERGDFRLGGCVIGAESPDYECGTCGSALPWFADD
jgi:hypothetical protein